jgi:hypothetical protein
MRPRRALWLLAAAAAVLIATGTVTLLMVRPGRIKTRVERVVSSHLHLTTTIKDLSIHFRTRAVLEASGVEIRVPARPDLPPFIAIERLSVEANPFRLATEIVRGRVQLVHVEGLRITIPPGETKHEVMPTGRSVDESRSTVIIGQLIAHDALLTILRRKSGDAPLVFHIHVLDMHELGFDRAIPFHAELTNPIPTGEVVSQGSVGPWHTAPSDLPIDGDYAFRHADLGTIRAIGGMMTSDGHYQGTLDELRVVGTTNTPDFNLDIGGKPAPLSTSFTAVVDGSSGTTHLETVEAKLFHTKIHAAGDIVNVPGPAGFAITIRARIEHGQIEDVLSLAMSSGRPPCVGDVSLEATIRLPAGTTPVRDRLTADGQFSLRNVRFTDGPIEEKFEALSRRGQGRSDDPAEPTGRLTSSLAGAFQMAAREIWLPEVRLDVPGASVVLSGTYALPTQELSFEGALRLQASLSDAVGGFKSVFVKPFDWLFRRDGAGAVIPIRIQGTRDHPTFGVRVAAALRRGR